MAVPSNPSTDLPQSILDSHVHFWNPQHLSYPWLNEIPSLKVPFLPEHLKSAIRDLPVKHYLFVQADCQDSEALEEVAWVTQLAEECREIVGIVAYAPIETEALPECLQQLKKWPLVCGVRRLIQSEYPGFCSSEAYVHGVKQVAEAGYTCDLCIRHTQLRDVIELVSRCPEVSFILDHLGKPDVRSQLFQTWSTEISALAEFPNVTCKLSGLITEADHAHWKPDELAPFLHHAIQVFGPDRLLFGSDWPVLTLAGQYKRWLEIVLEASSHFSVDQIHSIFLHNALRVYGLQIQ